MSFKIGQRVVCIKTGNYIDDVTKSIDNNNAPKKDEIVTINSIHSYRNNVYLQFKEYLYNGRQVNFLNSVNFRPLKYDSANEEIISKFHLTEEKADVEIRELETINQ